MELEKQNSLIYAMHCGLSESIQSKAQAGHFGRDKCFATLTQHDNFPMMQDRIQMLIKYVKAKALPNKTGLLVGEYLFELMCRYGVMDITITDQGKIELF